MPLLLFLNELSCESEIGPREVDRAMAEFVDTLRHLRGWRSVALTTRTPLLSSELASGYVYQQWLNDSGRNRDRHRFLLSLRSRSPFRSTLPASVDLDDVEYQCDGRTVEGIGAAHLTGGMAISLPVSTKWSAPWLEVDVHRLAEDTVKRSRDRVRHCSRPIEADEHAVWARASGLDALSTPAELLASWKEFFPHLQMLPRFERGLRRLDPKWFLPVRRLLTELETSVTDWDPALSPEPDWQNPHITPESASRRGLCTFTDLDGAKRCFSLHGRLTPGKGRLHFRLVPEARALRLGYVGDKLGSDLD